MTPEFRDIFEARVPRYTSYPTANHFGTAIGPESYRKWLAALPPEHPLSLYLHVPFCSKLCWYCGCHTAIVNSYAPVAGYAALLSREIDLAADALSARHSVSQIHWGGGTPTILSPADFVRLSAHLRRRFDVAADAHIAVEIDPRGFTSEMAAAMAGQGVTRASLGVQDFDPAVQTAVNRIQSYETTARCVEQLRAEGIEELNIDLIYGLPHQTPESVAATVDLTLSLAPDQIALFGYAHVPWLKRHQRLLDERALPGAAARWALYWAAAQRLGEHGMIPVGLDHFAAPKSPLGRAAAAGRLRRNFQGYTTDASDVILGFGASAIGTLAQGYVQNAAKLTHYREAIEAGRFATARGRGVGADDLLRRDVISGLMCNLSIDVGAICRAHHYAANALDAEIAALAPLESEGIVTAAGRKIAIKDWARPLARSVCAAFDAHYKADDKADGAPRHAQAV